MIPKIIHYCWFGGAPLPSIVQKCISSWKKYLPDYEIIEWNESNFNVHCCRYVEEAYNAKKWAFVSDYARFYVLNKYGGVYLDTDVELLKPLEPIVDAGPFFAMELDDPGTINPGLCFASEADSFVLQELLNQYETRRFVNEDGSLNTTTIVKYTTDYFLQKGFIGSNNIQMICGFTIYPSRFFNPTDMDNGKITITGDTYSIHHYAASWEDRRSVIRGKIYRLISRYFGNRFANLIRRTIRKLK